MWMGSSCLQKLLIYKLRLVTVESMQSRLLDVQLRGDSDSILHCTSRTAPSVLQTRTSSFGSFCAYPVTEIALELYVFTHVPQKTHMHAFRAERQSDYSLGSGRCVPDKLDSCIQNTLPLKGKVVRIFHSTYLVA